LLLIKEGNENRDSRQKSKPGQYLMKISMRQPVLTGNETGMHSTCLKD